MHKQQDEKSFVPSDNFIVFAVGVIVRSRQLCVTATNIVTECYK